MFDMSLELEFGTSQEIIRQCVEYNELEKMIRAFREQLVF